MNMKGEQIDIYISYHHTKLEIDIFILVLNVKLFKQIQTE